MRWGTRTTRSRAAPTLHLRALDQFATTTFPGTEGALAPFFSPDGLWIGFLTSNRDVKKVAVSGGPVSSLAVGASLQRGAPSWGYDHGIAHTVNGVAMRVGDGGGGDQVSGGVIARLRALLAAASVTEATRPQMVERLARVDVVTLNHT